MAKIAPVTMTTAPAPAAVPPPINLDAMGTEELLKHAEANNLDVGNASSRVTLKSAIKSGNKKAPPKAAAGTTKADLTPAEAKELSAIDTELAAIGDPQKAVSDLGERLAVAREKRTKMIAAADKEIGDLLNEHRHAQKAAGKACDRAAALRARRDRLCN